MAAPMTNVTLLLKTLVSARLLTRSLGLKSARIIQAASFSSPGGRSNQDSSSSDSSGSDSSESDSDKHDNPIHNKETKAAKNKDDAESQLEAQIEREESSDPPGGAKEEQNTHLLMKLLGHRAKKGLQSPKKSQKINLPKPGGPKLVQTERKKKVAVMKEHMIEKDPVAQLEAAAVQAAQSLGGDTEKVASDLLKKLQDHRALTKKQKQGQIPKPKVTKISDIVSGMEMDSTEPRPTHRPKPRLEPEAEGRMRRDWEGGRRVRNKRNIKTYKLFEGPALGIFPQQDVQHTPSEFQTRTLFDILEKENLEKTHKFPPTNSFQQMVEWTEEGKLWKFPIDNEQGMESELAVGFHEHVFLDHLIADFPKKGPVRHFMELVVVGLSKNPYLTVEQKHEHIKWFKDYFDDKKALLDEIIVLEEQPKNKEIS